MKEQKITGRERTLRTPSPGIVVANVKWIPSDNCQGSIEVFLKVLTVVEGHDCTFAMQVQQPQQPLKLYEEQ